jgi:tRNA(Met) cytidine acetyltransferase
VDLLLVDEAAAIPTQILASLLRRYPRCVFATTVHGYEGTGRGFAVRFRRVLDEVTPGWREVEMRAPIRWAEGDPLERLAFRALLLDANPAPADALEGVAAADCEPAFLDRDALAADERELGQLFGLLVLAHYRTSPLDLRHLLDGPDVAVAALRNGDQVAATALLTAEGAFDARTARRVYLGRRRLRGHLVPQTLSQHLGIEAAPRLRGQRIMRIAVHPAARRRGLGTRLVACLTGRARSAGLDYLAASFGAEPELLRFWARAGFLPVRIGVTRGTSTGTHAVVVIQPLSAAGAELFAAARERFHAQLPHMLCEVLRDLEPPLAARLLRRGSLAPEAPLGAEDWRDVVSFGYGLRQYEVCPGPVWRLAGHALADAGCADRLGADEQAVLVAKVLQKRTWKEVADLLGVPGRDAAVAALRAALRRLIQRYGGAAVQHEATLLAQQLRAAPED